MNMAVVSIIMLLAAIIIGFIKKVNVGIISIAFAFIIALMYKIPAGKIISGFSSSMAITMIGVMYLFSIITHNSTLEQVAKKITGLVGDRKFVLYIAMFFIGMLISGIGPGAIPTLAIAPVLAIPIALRSGMNPILLSLTGQMGAQAVRMSPITPEAVVVSRLMVAQGLNGNTVPAMWCLFVTEIFMVIASFIYLKGWKFTAPITQAGVSEDTSTKLNQQQWISLAGLAFMIFAVIFLKWNVGLTSFLIGTALILLKCGNDNNAIKSMPWNTILLVLGVGTLMGIVKLAGGVKLLADSIAAVSTTSTASPLMCVVAGAMSFFASGLGVVFPTLIPTVGGIAQNLAGVSPTELMAAVVIGGTITGFTPISTAGALILAGVSQFEGIDELYPPKKMFLDLCVVAVMAMAISVVLAFAGVYSAICAMF